MSYYDLLGVPRKWPIEGHTLLALTHSNLVISPMYQHVNFYWNGTLRKIKRLAEMATSLSSSAT